MNEAALKERLKTIATAKETTLNKVWKQLLLERFLARLSESPYQDKFIFKGGLLLAQYIAINRETIDIDFLMTKIKSEMQNIEKLMKEVAATNSGLTKRKWRSGPRKLPKSYFPHTFHSDTSITWAIA